MRLGKPTECKLGGLGRPREDLGLHLGEGNGEPWEVLSRR